MSLGANVKLLNGLSAASNQKKQSQLEDSLIRYEAKIGGKLFGPVPAGNRREFFCLDEHTWVWHEEWTDASGQRQSTTTRYVIRQNNGVVKTTGDGNYQRLSPSEARHLHQAVQSYQQKVHSAYEKILTPA